MGSYTTKMPALTGFGAEEAEQFIRQFGSDPACGTALRESRADQQVSHCREQRRSRIKSVVVKMNFAGGEIVHAADEADLAAVKHFAQNGAALANLLHHEPHVDFGHLVHKVVIF